MHSNPVLKQAILILVIGPSELTKGLCDNLATRYTNTTHISLSPTQDIGKQNPSNIDRPRLLDTLVAARLKLDHQMMFVSGFPETSLEAQHVVATYRDITVFCFEEAMNRQTADMKRVFGEHCKVEIVLKGRKPRRFIENILDNKFRSWFIDIMIKTELASV